MKKLFQFIIVTLVAITLFACNGAETKADNGTPEDKSEMKGLETVPEDKMPENQPAASAQPDTLASSTGGNEILSKIDSYLVSKNDLAKAAVTITNTLSNISFQKAIVEITFLDANGKAIKSEYFTIQNIEPGDIETIKLAPPEKTVSLETHIVKVKSNALTNGQMVLAGTHFEEGK